MEKTVCVNRRARMRYELLESFEAGIVLTGSEVKSLRAGTAHIKDSYVVIKDEEAYLVGCHISHYPPAGSFNHEPERERKLLLKKKEIRSLQGKIKQKGLTLIPLRIYFKDGIAKVELSLGKGKKLRDRREEIKKRDARREIDRYIRR